MKLFNWASLSLSARRELLRRPAVGGLEFESAVAEILASVREHGDQSLFNLTQKFDSVQLDSLICSKDEIRRARESVDPAVVTAIDKAIANVRKFHTAQIPQSIRVETAPGVVCERVSRPIDAVGLYVPAGSAPLPSAAIMLGVPAALAGCPLTVMATPPAASGRADPLVLTVAAKLGIDVVVKVGGAQAIAAMAYGTESVPKVAKIFGPGNAYVTQAKVAVASDAGGAAIDMPAGPSEVMVLADSGANPQFVAADLLSQAEHGPDSQVILVCTDSSTATEVITETQAQLLRLPRASIAAAALGHSAAIVVRSRDEAAEIANEYAPEHLIIQMQQARNLLASIRNAGSVFLGPWTPESVGDYCSGTNHVLPTYGFARAHSGLGVDDFCRRMTVQELSAAGLREIGPIAMTLAEAEGLDAHARAVSLRLAKMTDGIPQK